ncbi:LysR family transcriptional regulator [Roseateles violae]|uniref:LysR family transcriptional regulator n=1 Tax=Roseateles violae TaxID=3058042 RepID=A0ABT8DTH2_9BURK|nr:LysR family transcriptional regulator [Pelomonas sp. PFR6]MDN3921597.1 LysR family transcriptional regulator [Pelomonas sp. PFR6]
MEALNLLDSFIQSAETGGFSAAARRLGLTPAAVSKNVARLESRLGLRLFQRSTRRLTLTAGGAQFLRQVSGPYASLQEAFAAAAPDEARPSGVLKLSLGSAFGRGFVLPLLGDFMRRYPAVVPDWQFDNRPADLIGGGFDAAIGGGIELPQGVVARELVRTRIVAVASPGFMAGRPLPRHPGELAALDAIVRRSSSSGRVRAWTLRHAKTGEEAAADGRTRLVLDDPEAMALAAAQDLGVALLPRHFAARLLDEGRLLPLLPDWAADIGAVSLYYPNKKLLPPRTRVFVDYLVAAFRDPALRARF